jgi:uncharacterized protein YbjT (DUF2867 family)
MDGVDQAYYLVHSMANGPGFAVLDRRAASNFGRAAARAGVRRIIYLGGLGDSTESLSIHLKSRMGTGEALREAGVPVVEFRASIIVGAGSLSFEMIGALVERLPIMICPRWVDTRTQPIAIDDVLAYLRAALDLPDGRAGIFEIGGPEVVSYGDMMRQYAALRGLRRAFASVPVLTPRLSGLWLGLVTPAQAGVGRALVEGLRNPDSRAFAVRARDVRDPADAAARRIQARNRRKRGLALQDRHPRGDGRRAASASVCAHPTDWRRHRLVLCRRPVAATRLARPTGGRCRPATTPARPGRLPGWRCHRRMARRGVRA